MSWNSVSGSELEHETLLPASFQPTGEGEMVEVSWRRRGRITRVFHSRCLEPLGDAIANPGGELIEHWMPMKLSYVFCEWCFEIGASISLLLLQGRKLKTRKAWAQSQEESYYSRGISTLTDSSGHWLEGHSTIKKAEQLKSYSEAVWVPVSGWL